MLGEQGKKVHSSCQRPQRGIAEYGKIGEGGCLVVLLEKHGGEGKQEVSGKPFVGWEWDKAA